MSYNGGMVKNNLEAKGVGGAENGGGGFIGIRPLETFTTSIITTYLLTQ